MSRRDGLASSAAAVRFKLYPAYKDSGVEWLGEIPAHWEVRRIRHVVRRIEQGWSPDCENREAGEEEWGVLKAGCVNRGVFIESEHKALPAGLEPIPKLEIGPGDLLMSRASGSRELVGSVAVVPSCRPRLLLCDKVFRLHVGAETSSRQFLAYAMNSRIARWQIELVLSGGSGLANNIAQEVVKDLILAQPATDEQRAIAAFLDRETARIDALLAKKERLIELLQEKRTALITRAVTKGLDPNVPTKDSGVEWLGEIPSHWEMKALKRIGGLQAGAGFPDDEQGVITEDIPFFKVGDMGSTGNEREMLEVKHTVSVATAHRLRAFVFPRGTIVFAKVGAALLLNRRRFLTRPSCMDNNMMGFMPGDCDPTWAMYWLSGLDMGKLANPGAVPSVNEGQMRDTPAIVPPEPEQRAIAAFLDQETARIYALIAKVHDAIDRLKELRTALISAAVTGKIDVREGATT